ncbi:MAG: 50S ribosomal protein L29 [Bacilli bacterium]|nr:50S ribosomal protein L29 [Bacilli bacterium]
MKVNEIRNLTTDEIVAKIKETKEELFNLRFQQATGNLDKPSKIKDLRHTVARLKTVLRERELEESNSKN